MATASTGPLRRLLEIERAAFQRVWARHGAVALGLFAVEVGALALVTALGRLRVAVKLGTLPALETALTATGLGLDLCLVFGCLGFGLAAVAVARPLTGRALFLPAARTSGGAVSIYGLSFFVAYALGLGVLQLEPQLSARTAAAPHGALVLSLALAPIVALLVVLGAGALAGVALVARGLTPGRALAIAFDHVLRGPELALPLFVLHAGLGAVALVAARALTSPSAAAFVALAPIAALLMILAIAAFDAALARDPRLSTG